MAFLLLFLPLLFFLTVPPSFRATTEETALRYARDYLTSYYYQHKTFPDTLTVPGYPFVQYSHGGNPTGSSGVPNPQSWATVRLAGPDRRFGTADDRVLTLTASMLEKAAFLEELRRARILEQAAYNVCQRRLASGVSPIWPANLDELVKEANLPTDYEKTPFGANYVYDTSSCRTDYCYCSQAIVRAP